MTLDYFRGGKVILMAVFLLLAGILVFIMIPRASNAEVPAVGEGADAIDPRILSLNGEWLFKKDTENVGIERGWWNEKTPLGEDWMKAPVPSAWELFADEDFNGVGWYRKTFEGPEDWRGMRVWLEFDAVSTVATAYVNGQEVGTHTGDYVRFRFEITDAIRFGERNEVTVRVDEFVGHVTQGFLSVISLHHGGIWGDVRIYATGELAIGVNGIYADADPDRESVAVTVAFDGEVEGGRFPYELWITPADSSQRVADVIDFADVRTGEFSNVLHVSSPRLWEPGNPGLYKLHVRLLNIKGELSDEACVTFAFRKVEADGEYLKLNDRPITFRAALDWGYYRDKVAPAPEESTIRRQFAELKKLGFNGVKLVLVMMNPVYYDIADEMGILLWQEYPLWHMPIDKTTRDELMRMYEEFYKQDRNHPSIILRSITCESGGVDQEVMGDLYQLGKRIIPGSLLEDNSSWLWLSNPEYADYWDEHPYLTNPQWVRYIENLDNLMAEREPKPFLLGEAMAFNTWIDTEALLQVVGDTRPWWLPRVFDSAVRIESQLTRQYRRGAVQRLLKDSMRYALLHRKFQIELFRTRPGDTGYVVNVIRDMPLIRAGLYDDLERLRWTAEDWKFQSDVALTLKSPEWRRGFFLDEEVALGLFISNFGARDIMKPTISQKAKLLSDSEGGRVVLVPMLEGGAVTRIAQGEVARLEASVIKVSGGRGPVACDYEAGVEGIAENSWRIWFFTRPDWAWQGKKGVYVHAPGYSDMTAYMPGVGVWDETKEELPANARVIFSDVLTRKILDFVNGGGKAIILASNWPGAFGAIEHSYWRDVPFLPRTVWSEMEAQAILEMQSYDLVKSYSMVVPTGEAGIAEKVQPLLRLLDTHDLSEVAIYDQLFETGIGRGVLAVASLDFSTPAGQWLLSRIVDRLLTTEPPITISLTYEEAKAFSVPSPYALIPLLGNWKFALDPDDVGVEEGWYLPDYEDSAWRDLAVARHWEGFGINYDGWAWYRRSVEIPAEFAGSDVELIAEGIDDVYGVYVNGSFVQFHGDMDLGHPEGSVWLKRTVTKVGDFLNPGQRNLIAIRVLDWTGAGGIWKPIYLAVAQK